MTEPKDRASPDSGVPVESTSRPQPPATDEAWLAAVRASTPARLLVGRAGAAYRTATQLELRADHAAARDAVLAEVDPARDFGADFVAAWPILALDSAARDKHEYLMRPELGRQLSDHSRDLLARDGIADADVQIVIGDGLSAAAVARQIPRILPGLVDRCVARGWRIGRLLFVRHCRVGVINAIGELLHPRVVVLLIGERPGLATAESLSAYFAFQPRDGHTDADRNLISNIHDRGVTPDLATARIVALIDKLLRAGKSGVSIKEDPITPLALNRPLERLP